ncbi:MAG: ABC transporter ATP-binding protein [Clostridiales bacterium]|nr:ABC transporter ATP-binding protein [Clostridiales bacterium]
MLALALLNFLVIDRTKKIDKKLVWDELAPYWRKSYYIECTTSDFEIAKDIRMFSMGKWLMQKFKEIQEFMHSKIVKSRKLWIRAHTTNHFIFLIQQGILYAWLVYGVLYRDVTIGNFTLYLGTVTVFYGTLTDSLNNIADIRHQSREVNDFRTFMEYPEPNTNKKTIPIPVTDTYEFKFEDVSFRYINADKFALKGLNLTVTAGERLAVVGLNGAGKTTFIKLLCGLYRPTQGRILLNGIDVNNFDKVEYFKLFAPVFQDINLFAFPVAENISMRTALQPADKTDDDLVYESLQLAGISDKIDSLPKGTKSHVLKVLHDDGVDFSGGERQKIALARALYKNSPVVILDEPTSALDALAEYKLYQDFDKLISDKTAVYISHRLSSTRFCNNIAMFADGELIEYGTHHDLIQSGGPYSDMFAVQSQYYKDGKEAKVNA